VELREPEPSSEPPDGVEVHDGVDVPEVLDVPAESAEPSGRRYPSTVGGTLYLLVLAASGLGLGIVASGDWRVGVRWIGGALVCAALARLLLPAREAGMLAVRRRWIDVTLLVVVGAALLFLATSIPDQPPL
jgi:hypothetical protein